jgi:serine/threonine-protein kinase SRPK3
MDSRAETVLRYMEVICEEERAALLEMLHWMLAWRPEERPTATQVLGTTWMKRWALPTYNQGQTA